MTRHNYEISRLDNYNISKLNNFMSSNFVKWPTYAALLLSSTLEKSDDYFQPKISKCTLEQKESLNETVNSKGLESKLKNK
jgi:hypothetical protein